MSLNDKCADHQVPGEWEAVPPNYTNAHVHVGERMEAQRKSSKEKQEKNIMTEAMALQPFNMLRIHLQ